jgi:hypothetical protein
MWKAMTAATQRRTSPHGSAVRWTWAGVVALIAALAVLVHHDTTVMPSPALSSMSSMGAMPGMEDHGSAAMAAESSQSGHDAQVKAAAPASDGGASACTGPAMLHCASGDVGTAKFAPPLPVLHGAVDETEYGMLAGHRPPGETPRAPPDLTLLSRLLI